MNNHFYICRAEEKPLEIREFQNLIRQIYLERDQKRGARKIAEDLIDG